MYFDREMLFMKDRSFWLSMLCLILAGIYFKAKIVMEMDRWHMWNRREKLREMPAHHFHNRGGVLLMKQFAGFEKYHTNNNDMMHWYTKSYPDAFRKA